MSKKNQRRVLTNLKIMLNLIGWTLFILLLFLCFPKVAASMAPFFRLASYLIGGRLNFHRG